MRQTAVVGVSSSKDSSGNCSAFVYQRGAGTALQDLKATAGRGGSGSRLWGGSQGTRGPFEQAESNRGPATCQWRLVDCSQREGHTLPKGPVRVTLHYVLGTVFQDADPPLEDMQTGEQTRSVHPACSRMQKPGPRASLANVDRAQVSELLLCGH